MPEKLFIAFNILTALLCPALYSPQTGTGTHIAGYIYQTVKIGNQW
jgi:hypothetical protein